MKPFLRRASYLDKFNVLHNLNEYIREYIVKYGDYVITAYVDCPQELKSGLIRISLNAGLNIDGFVNAYDNLSDTQVRMLEHNLPNFMGWFINSKYVAKKHDDNLRAGNLERFAFYERAKKAYAVIATGEGAIYANVIIKKGVI